MWREGGPWPSLVMSLLRRSACNCLPVGGTLEDTAWGRALGLWAGVQAWVLVPSSALLFAGLGRGQALPTLWL